MNTQIHGKTAVIAAGTALLGASLVAAGTACAQPAHGPSEAAAPVSAASHGGHAAAGQRVMVAHPAGTFSCTQDVVTPTDQIARTLGGADKVLCGATQVTSTVSATPAEDALSWSVTVEGDGVANPYAATLSEMAEEGSYQTVMGCTCLGNPADGRATANAAVEGVELRSILERAAVLPEANTVTFVSRDGSSTSLPLSYVTQRTSLLVFAVNGAPLQDSVGGTNQLWLGATAARYFTRDVVSIRVTCEANPPAAPGSAQAGDAYANRPNVGVLTAQA